MSKIDLPRIRSAGWQPAVSRIGNPQRSLLIAHCRLPVGDTADCQSALRLGNKPVYGTRPTLKNCFAAKALVNVKLAVVEVGVIGFVARLHVVRFVEPCSS